MRLNRISLRIGCLLCAVTECAAALEAAPVAKTLQAETDLGQVLEGSRQSLVLLVKNEGDGQLLLGPQVKLSCDCSEAELARNRIPVSLK